MKTSIKINVVFITLFMVIAASCKKFVQIPPPKNQLVSSTVFADSLGADAAINGVYINMMQYVGLTFTNGGVTLYTGLTGDELYESQNNSTDLEFYNNAITVNNGADDQLWVIPYKYIYDTNACIEGIKAGTNISLSAKNSLTGEALLIRSFIYFNLVNLYGPVPLVTGTDYNTNRLVARTPVQQIYAQLIADLKTAQSGLSKNTDNNTRANYYAATALLAKVYLYNHQYTDAAVQANIVINSGNYNLVTDLNTAFLTGSTETIWSFAPVQPGKQTSEGYYFVPTQAGVTPNYIITNTLYNSFESGDLRKVDWIGANSVSGVIYPYPFKYKTGLTSGASTENYVVLRLADQYLIAAEAETNANDLADALVNLNIVRNRAGLQSFASNDKQKILTAIVNERQHEMFCEWGNRWFDLNRLNMANTIFGVDKQNWKSTSALYPVPQTEISANPNLTQNLGY